MSTSKLPPLSKLSLNQEPTATTPSTSPTVAPTKKRRQQDSDELAAKPKKYFRYINKLMCPACGAIMTEKESQNDGAWDGVLNRIGGFVFKCCGNDADQSMQKLYVEVVRRDP